MDQASTGGSAVLDGEQAGFLRYCISSKHLNNH